MEEKNDFFTAGITATDTALDSSITISSATGSGLASGALPHEKMENMETTMNAMHP